MPLLPQPDTQTLEDHFFGSGVFSFGWFITLDKHFPATIKHYPDIDTFESESFVVTETDFNEAIKKYAETLHNRNYCDLIEDMDAVDVDACIQLAVFGEIRYG